jgi:hypothetical protein
VQILYDAGYDPAEGMRFFTKLQEQTKGKTPSLSGHPDLANRIGTLNKEIARLGGTPANAMIDSEQFQNLRLLTAKFPEPR